MPVRRGVARVIGLSLAAWLAALPASAERPALSAANRLLFNTDHLAALNGPAALHYRFEQHLPRETAFTDAIELSVTPSPAGEGKDVRVRYFTGERARFVPTVTGAQGNPVVMVFLQRDVNEMARRTQGSFRHFQRMIKLALEDRAQVAPTEVAYQGRRVEAVRIGIQPFVNDPYRERFSALADVRYEFVLSEHVPGWVCQLSTVLPNAGPASVLQLRGVEVAGD